jgi:ABC-type sugar transport system ATPase subunit
MKLLEAKNINISFSGTQILFDVAFELSAGEISCLCGENGAGKSTLIKIFSGINSNYTGQVSIQGENVRLGKPADAVAHGIYAVQQHRDLAPTLNAVENIFLNNEIYLGRFRQRLNRVAMREQAKKYIGRFGVEFDLGCPVSSLSVAEQGIVAICKALARNSRILLIDEASAPLDDTERQYLYDALRNLAKEGKGIVYITHHLDEVFRIGDSVTVLRDGRNAGRFPIDAIDKQDLIEHMTGNVALYSHSSGSAGTATGATVLEVEGIEAEDLEEVSFTLSRGEILGIAGLEGSGNKQIAECCFGYRRIRKGKMRLQGNSFSPKSPIQAIQRGIGLVPDNRKVNGLVLCKNVSENIIIVEINRFRKTIVSGKYADTVARSFVRKLKIRCAGVHQLIEYLSGGNQQKVLVAKWLDAKVDVLFMVEPTEGIDVGARADLYGIFREMARDGMTIVIVTSDIDELMELSDRILTMRKGRIVAQYDAASKDKQQILADILLADAGKEESR